MAASPAQQLLLVMGERILSLQPPCDLTAIEEKALASPVGIGWRGETLNALTSLFPTQGWIKGVNSSTKR